MAERDDDGFLGRWSRRKIEARHGEPEGPAPEGAEAGEAPAEPEEAPPRHPAEDIDIDSLGRGSDFRIFMEKGVPPELRRKALQKLWRSDPVFANLDGLDDYFDLAKPEKHGIGPMRATAWNLGRGFLTEEEISPPPEEPEIAEAETGEDEAEAPDEDKPEEA